MQIQAAARPAGAGPPRSQELEHPDPLRLLEEKLAAYRAPHLPGLPRFCGGAVGYAGYDTVRYVERLPHPPPDDRHLPDLCFAFYDRMVIFDHINKTIAVVAHAHVDPQRPGAAAISDACARVDRLVERLQQGVADLQLTDIAPIGEVRLPYRSNFEPAAFEAAVEKCKEYIKAGDIFQVVLSQRLQTETKARPFDIYRTLRVVNPSPFMFYLKAGPLCLVGSSPEIMVRVEGDQVTIRPLAGTRPPRQDRGGGRAPGRRIARRPQGAGRAHHAGRPGPQRRRPGRPLRHGAAQRRDDGGALQPRHAHLQQRDRPAAAGQDAPSTPCVPACRPAR